MNVYCIKPIKNGYLVRLDEEVVAEWFYETELEAIDALRDHLFKRKFNVEQEGKQVNDCQ